VVLVNIPRTWCVAFTLWYLLRSCPICVRGGAKWWYAVPESSNISFHVNRSIGCGDITWFVFHQEVFLHYLRNH
jgi:hypothetical protein